MNDTMAHHALDIRISILFLRRKVKEVEEEILRIHAYLPMMSRKVGYMYPHPRAHKIKG